MNSHKRLRKRSVKKSGKEEMKYDSDGTSNIDELGQVDLFECNTSNKKFQTESMTLRKRVNAFDNCQGFLTDNIEHKPLF